MFCWYLLKLDKKKKDIDEVNECCKNWDKKQLNSSTSKCLWVQFVTNKLHDIGFSQVWNNHIAFNSCSFLV